MRDKLIIILIFFLQLGMVQPATGQKAVLLKANRYFSHQEYSLAAKHFETYLKNKTYITTYTFKTMLSLSQCYKMTNEDEKALNLYQKIVEAPQAKPEHYLVYAQLLKHTQKYQEAKKWFTKYKTLTPADTRIDALIHSCDLINELETDSLYIIHPLNINTPQSDFASAFYKEGIVFLSGRPNNTSSSIDRRTGEHYLDLYYSKKQKRNHSTPVAFSKIFNTKYHEGPACFSQNQRFIYFTRNKQGVNLEGKSELNIYTARFNGKHWDKPELFQFAGYYYSMGHPSLSPDGQYLYFISNMEGGYGGTDIYVCQKQGFGWSRPVNLGPQINTMGNEMFPYMAEDNYLYFASNGHVGLGGLDIFKSLFHQNQWSVPTNIGPPFNSSGDDFGFFINTNKDHGYFSSNRPGGKGGDDIYEFEINPERAIHLQGRISNAKTKTALDKVEITLIDKLSKEGSTHTDSLGNFHFLIAPNKDYSLIIRKPGFKTKRILYFAKQHKHRKKPRINIRMETTPWKKLSGKIIDSYTNRNLKNATVQVISKPFNINQLVKTDPNGYFELAIDPEKSYRLLIQCKGYFTKVVSDYKHEDGKFEKVKLQRIAKNRYMELEGHHFKKGTYKLSGETQEELQNLAYLLINNPHITIELGAYTYMDKGRKENEKLCTKRAQEAANFIINKGIAPNRITLKSLGYNKDHAQLVAKVTEAF
ncbi:MAG: carboxypeptidase regulatory-like domain-containing protein [Marinifilaceae bacterium]